MISKKINKTALVALLALLICISIFGFIADAAEFVIRTHHGLPINHYLDRGMNLWAEKVKNLTDGRVEVRLYPAAQLYNDVDVVQAVMMGDIDACWNYDHKFYTVMPSIGGYGAPGHGIGAYTPEDTRKAVEASYDGLYAGYGPGYENAKNFEKIGLKFLYYIYWTSSYTQYGSKGKQVRVPEDLKGRKIRSGTAADSDFYAHYGAQPIALTGGELYEAMARNLINTANCNAQHLVDRNLMEVVDYVTYPGNPSTCIGQVVINMNYWNKIPKDLQDLIIQAGTETELEYRGVLDEDSEKLNDIARQHTNFVELTPEETKAWLDGILPFWVEGTKALGPEAISMYNSCQDFKESIGIIPFPKIE